ncbi:MAG: 50S ribosomal protein L13 [Actinobacteria bacterium]|nr:50S ribosomal protein L13 [Actinomycetota bacterium]
MVLVGSKTFSAKKKDIEKKWFLIDAKGKNLGRLSTEIVKILRGKNKPVFTPNIDCGDYIIVINASEIKVTGNKLADKLYYRHSGYVGNLKSMNLKEMLEKNPNFVLRNSVKGMLPHNKISRHVLKKLKIYAGDTHPHEAQKPQKIVI